MPYLDWKRDFVAATSTDPKRTAQLWNIERDGRVRKTCGQFKRLIGREHRQRLGAGQPSDQAALGALDTAIKTTWRVDSKWLGLLPVPPGTSLPARVDTHVAGDTILRYHTLAPMDVDSLPRTLTRITPLKAKRGPKGYTVAVRFIWVTFAADEAAASRESPTVVKKELGLADVDQGDLLYRVELPIAHGQTCFIPTCLDAHLYYAWKPPPRGHTQPWGLTRDLTTGGSRWPELLVETADYIAHRPNGELVSPPGAQEAVGPVMVDYMAGR